METADARLYRDVLGGSTAFRDLAPPVLEELLACGLLLKAKAGDVVFFEKMRGPGLCVVLAGELEIFRVSVPKTRLARPRRVRLNTLRPGACFGEYSLIDGKESSASARALTAAALFFLPRGEFLRITEHDAAAGRAIYRNLLLVLIERLRQRDQPQSR